MYGLKPMYHPDVLPIYRRNQLLADKAKLVKLRTEKHEECQQLLAIVCVTALVIALILTGLMMWNAYHDTRSFWGFMGPAIGAFISACVCVISGQSDGFTTDEVSQLDAQIQRINIQITELQVCNR